MQLLHLNMHIWVDGSPAARNNHCHYSKHEEQGNMVVIGMGTGLSRNAELLLQAPLSLLFAPQS